MSNDKQIRFHQLLEIQINNIIQARFVGQLLTPFLMREIREAIKTQVVDIFSKSKYNLSDKASTWLTDQYFKAIKINDDQTMSDQVVINEYELSELETLDVVLLRNVFVSTHLSANLDTEFYRRNGQPS